jgi:mono/diheme cytochrome c family protein
MVLPLVLVACNVFPEMHYSPAVRRGEPTRHAPPPDAVPISGARPAYTFEEATSLRAPIANAEPDRTNELYRVNCSVCHGADGRGQSLISDRFRAAGAIPPVDLTSARVQNRTDGQLYWLIGNGIGNMPPFGSLLTDDELWAVVTFTRQLPSD